MSIAATEFLSALYANCAYQAELRMFPPGERQPLESRYFVEAADATSIAGRIKRARAQNHQVFISMATRLDATSGKAENCAELPALWADLDFKSIDEAQARRDIATFPVPPSSVVRSGNGLHCYWWLREPLDLRDPDERAEAARLLKRIAAAIGGDPSVTELARVMRAPRSRNLKNPDAPLEVEIEHLDAACRYNPSDFDVLPDVASTAGAAAPAQAVNGIIPNGQRGNTLYAVGRGLHARGIVFDGIREALSVINLAQCQPPLDEGEIVQIATQCVTQADRPDFTPPAPEKPARAPEPLPLLSVRELIAEVQAAGPQTFLFRGMWPAGDYGVLAGEPKTQKTQTASDATVSVASGTPFLNHFPVDTAGPVLFFAGEGGKASILRRLDAVARSRGLCLGDLPITVCPRAPHFASDAHLDQIREALARTLPSLVIVDPYYLAARGVNAQSVTEAGALLERIQHVCQDAKASLLVVHHHNRSRDAKGALRISGAGPAEWGRILLMADVLHRSTHPTTKATDVLTRLDLQGGQVADQSWRVRRRIWTDDPDDLNAAMHYDVRVEASDDDATEAPEGDRLSPAATKLLEALQATTGLTSTSSLVDAVVQRHGHGLRRETVSRSLKELERRGLAESVETGAFREKLWRRPDPGTAASPVEAA